MNILLSWTAFNNDYLDGQVRQDGPTMQFHEHFFSPDGNPYDTHILLSSAKAEDIRIDHLLSAIRRKFPSHSIQARYMDISDVIDISEIRPKVEKLLLGYKDDRIDIFFSPGTSIMQMAWYSCHQSLGLNTRLLQTRSSKVAKSNKPELTEIRLEQSAVPFSAMIREQKQDKIAAPEAYRITNSIKPVYEKATKIAQAETVTCLICGESGTGKEHLARYIHDQSARKAKPFVAINCSALGDSLLESRLFGYRKGAFTDAREDHKGLLEEAAGGTVFLDEIGDISAYMQQSLLRVLQQKEILPIGATRPVKVDVRIVAATNKDLPRRCADGSFRWDLYYRLSVVELALPTLQERGLPEKEEMIDFFLRLKKRQMRKQKTLALSAPVREYLLHYPFPGNIRELENVIESFYVFCQEQVEPSDLPARLLQTQPTDSSPFDWKRTEKTLIAQALRFYRGNQAQAQRALGYGSINTLKKKMEAYAIPV